MKSVLTVLTAAAFALAPVAVSAQQAEAEIKPIETTKSTQGMGLGNLGPVLVVGGLVVAGAIAVAVSGGGNGTPSTTPQ